MVDIPRMPAFFLKGKGEGMDLEERTRRSGGGGSCIWDVIHKRRINFIKERKKTTKPSGDLIGQWF